jgi:DNA-binding transcriptional regulator YiaG
MEHAGSQNERCVDAIGPAERNSNETNSGKVCSRDPAETIASILLEERRALSGPELRWLRKFVGVPRQLIAKIIPPSSDQILAWETGREPVEERYSTCIRLLAAQRVRVTDFREFEQHVEEAQASSRPRPRIAKRGLTWEPEPVAA